MNQNAIYDKAIKKLYLSALNLTFSSNKTHSTSFTALTILVWLVNCTS